MAVFIFEEGVWGMGVFLFEEVGCQLLVVKVMVAVVGLAVVLVVGISTVEVEVVGKEVGMMVVLGMEWGYGQGLQEWLQHGRYFHRKRSLLRTVMWVVCSVFQDRPAR